MQLAGEFSVASGVSETWELMIDPESIGDAIPNCQSIEVEDERNYTAEIGVSVSKISVTFDVDAEIVEMEEQEYLEFQLQGSSKEGDSRMQSQVQIWLTEGEDDSTDLEWENHVDVTGRIMNMGSRIVKSVGKRQTNKTISNVEDELGVPERKQEESSSLF
jgi:carbon monoxide dehydrogenase subunit G